MCIYIYIYIYTYPMIEQYLTYIINLSLWQVHSIPWSLHGLPIHLARECQARRDS